MNSLLPMEVTGLLAAGMGAAFLGSVKVPLARKLEIDENRVGGLVSTFGLAMIPVVLVMGFLGELIYSQGEYYHYGVEALPSYKGWRIGLPPQYYPTHSNAYQIAVAGGSFAEVSCMGMPGIQEQFQPRNNRYKNPFGTQIALFRTSTGGYR